MLIKIKLDGSIPNISGIRNPEIYRFYQGSIVSFENPEMEDFKNGSLMYEHPYIGIINGNLQFISFPAYFHNDMYYVIVEEGLILGTDFFEVSGYMKKCSMNHSGVIHFKNKSYFPIEETLLKEVHRFIPHSVYEYSHGELIRHSIRYEKNIKFTSINNTDKKLYEEFKISLDQLIDHYANNKKNAVLLSGGADSRLLALLLKERGHDLQTYTAKQIPYSIQNLVDVEEATLISRKLNIKHNIVDTDFNALDIKMLDNVISKMPLAMHLSAFFNDLTKAIRGDAIENVWCGQNADNLYNLGPTSKISLSFSGMMNLYKRFCISEHYYKSFNSVEGYSRLNKLISYPVTYVGLKVYARMKKDNLIKMPKSPQELIYNFSRSYDDTIFSSINSLDCDIINNKKYSPQEIKNILFNIKVENYLHGGASKVISTTAQLNSVKAILPFSNELMIPIFNQIRLKGKDLLFPKRYIYRYIREFENKYGKKISQYNSISTKLITKKYNNAKNVHTSAEAILFNTDFGNNLINIAGTKGIENGKTGIQKLQLTIADYWIIKVKSILENKYGIEIN